jgi:hypothetical protein
MGLKNMELLIYYQQNQIFTKNDGFGMICYNAYSQGDK